MKTFLLAALLLLPGAASAASAFGGEPVKDAKQLVGCWKREVYADEAMARISQFDFFDPVSQKYQWFCFRENGDFRALTDGKYQDLDTAGVDRLFNMFPASQTWKLKRKGVVHIENPKDPAQSLDWKVSIAKQPERVDEKAIAPEGALYMGIMDKGSKRYSLLRVLTRLH